MPNMNVLFVYSHGIRPSQGGTERVIYLVSNALRELGHQVYFLSLYDSVDDLDARLHVAAPDRDDVKIAEFMRDLCERWDIDVVINEIGEFCDYVIYSKVRELRNVLLISCIHFDVLGPMKFFYTDEFTPYRISSCRAILSWLKYRYCAWLRRTKFIRKRKSILGNMLAVSDCIVVPAVPLIDQLRSIHRSKCDIVCISNPNSLEKCISSEPPAKKKLALYVGRLSRQKHVERIIEAWHRAGVVTSEWKLVIAGSGAMEDELRQRIAELQLTNVEMLGHVENVQILYRDASLTIQASDHESFSLSLLESLSSGCYPIVLDFPAARTLLKRADWGTRVQPHTTQALAEAIREAICENRSNAPFYPDIVEHLQSFSPGLIGSKWDELLRRLVHERGNAQT